MGIVDVTVLGGLCEAVGGACPSRLVPGCAKGMFDVASFVAFVFESNMLARRQVGVEARIEFVKTTT